MERSLRPPAEAGGLVVGRERAGRQAGREVGPVVARRCDVVDAPGVEDGGEVLDLPSPDAELGLAAAVDLDPALGAVVIGREERLRGAEARRLDVDRAWREGEPFDVRAGVDRSVPGD